MEILNKVPKKLQQQKPTFANVTLNSIAKTLEDVSSIHKLNI